MGALSLFVSLATILAISLQVSGLHIPELIRQPLDRNEDSSDFCLSWRFGVETNNIRDWTLVPKVCRDYMADYFKGGQYLEDSKVVINQSISYAKSVELVGDGKDIWIFAFEETAVSYVDFFAKYGYGTEPVDPSALLKVMKEGKLPALPESLKLYRSLLSLGIKVVFLVGRPEYLRNSTETNLQNVGYHTWEKLILRDSSQLNQTQKEYKSAERTELVESGYRIVGNIGAQWSDLLGANPGDRTFKLPNPMYYAA